MPYTYMLQCADGTYYTGWTVDLNQRLKAHNDGTGARYTRCRRPVRLMYWEEQPDRSTAQRREASLRCLRKSVKDQMVTTFQKQLTVDSR
jgi:putative endonuclease